MSRFYVDKYDLLVNLDVVIEVRRSTEFDQWLKGLRDVKAMSRIASRVDRIALSSNLGDVKRFDGLLEIRCDFGPGYRLYGRARWNADHSALRRRQGLPAS